jgi:hypothetical protein
MEEAFMEYWYIQIPEHAIKIIVFAIILLIPCYLLPCKLYVLEKYPLNQYFTETISL